MDFYNNRDTYILCKGESSLWCNRVNGNLQVRSASAIQELPIKPKCLGMVYGVVGKIRFLPGSDDKLVLITKRYEVGKLTDESPIYRIEKIAVVSLSSDECPEIEFDSREEHSNQTTLKQVPQPRVAQTFSNFKTSLANQFNKATTTKTNYQKAADKDIARDKEKMDKLERRLQEEFMKMFNDSQSFYYSECSDLTNTVQRNVEKDEESKKLPIWKVADKRFFWNKAMLEEIISLTELDVNANEWILPIIQGYVQTALCEVDYSESGMNDHMLLQMAAEKFDLILISRRSVARAGTRYKRRGVDEDGNVANYVETEQIVRAGFHYLSFVQVRGSIPLFWSQAGIKYRPPPKLEKNKEESQHAMRKHLEKELALYKNVTIVNLVEQSGREQVLSDAFMEQIIVYDNPLLTYVTFDFHEYCRGMRFENVSKLVEGVASITDAMRFSWVDNHGVIWEQQGVFRVNCMDCLDRTNVVQAALARYVLRTQLTKLGRLMPESNLPADIRDIYQNMWANNADIISRQYAGTAAMKGDFTRTGERKFSGVMKDGYHSANRYLNQFTAAYRQTVTDIMLGIFPTEDITVLIAAMKQPEDTGEEWTLQREEWVAQLVEQCHQLLVREGELYLGGWALVEPLIGLDSEGCDFEQEVVLLLTEKAFYIASYDEEEECVKQYECQPLESVEKIEIGTDVSQRSPNSALRLHYRSREEGGYFHTFKALQNREVDEDKDVLHGIADEFRKATLVKEMSPKVIECRLTKRKSKPHDVIQLSCKTRPCTADNHYRCKKTSCSPKTMVHSSSAPAKLDKLAIPSKTAEAQGNITDSYCFTNNTDVDRRDLSGFEKRENNVFGEVENIFEQYLSEKIETNDDTTRVTKISTTSGPQGYLNDSRCSEINEGTDSSVERNINFDKEKVVDCPSSESDSASNVKDVDNPSKMKTDKNFAETELNNGVDLPGAENGQQSSVNEQNFSEGGNLTEINAERDFMQVKKSKEDVHNNKRNDISFDVIASPKQNKQENYQENETEMSKTNVNTEGKTKPASENSSAKTARKPENVNSEPSSGLAANIKKNFKNRFADVSIRFRKNYGSINTSEIRLQEEDSEDVQKPARPDGRRNILAAAQDRGRAFIPELKNKFSARSNRSPRLQRRREWEKFIEESGCRTTIIQI